MKHSTTISTAAALLALAIGGWATLAAADSSCAPCTDPNGRGIYILERIDYCINYQGKRFCPEAFVQAGGGSTPEVELKGRLFDPSESQVSYKLTATFKNNPVPLIGVTGARSRLSFRYLSAAGPAEIKGDDLPRLTLTFAAAFQGLELRLKESRELINGKRVYRYEGTWRMPDASERAFCPDKNNMYTLYAKEVDGRIGKVTDQPHLVTTACETGAIATCMNWGYRPSWLGYTAPRENALLGACIQAKRAAYFLASGDTESYTVDGTKIALRDYCQVRNDPINRLEALWTEDGALCLNASNRRTDDPRVLALPAHWQARLAQGECPPTLPTNWKKLGIIATGKAATP